MKTCNRCNAKLDDAAKFCPKCGSEIKNEEERQPSKQMYPGELTEDTEIID